METRGGLRLALSCNEQKVWVPLTLLLDVGNLFSKHLLVKKGQDGNELVESDESQWIESGQDPWGYLSEATLCHCQSFGAPITAINWLGLVLCATSAVMYFKAGTRGRREGEATLRTGVRDPQILSGFHTLDIEYRVPL